MDDVTEAVQNPLAALNEGGRWRGASNADGALIECLHRPFLASPCEGEVASRSDDGEVEALTQTQRIAAEGGGAPRRGDGEVEKSALSQCVEESARNALRRSTPQEDLAERLAEEYLELRQFLPTVGEWSTLPTAVIREAAETGRSLLDAYLRHDYRERMRVETETAAQAAASAVSVGSLFSAPAAEPSAAERAMLQGVWNT